MRRATQHAAGWVFWTLVVAAGWTAAIVAAAAAWAAIKWAAQ